VGHGQDKQDRVLLQSVRKQAGQLKLAIAQEKYYIKSAAFLRALTAGINELLSQLSPSCRFTGCKRRHHSISV
jgi:hypothetical protein